MIFSIWRFGETLFARGAVFLLKFYQLFISPLKPPTCRFYPTCSAYAIQSIEKYGFVKGVCKSIYRLSRCHPFHRGGYDPV